MKTFKFILLLLILHTNIGHAQNFFQNSEYQMLNMSDGLCNNTVTDINQDDQGILWFSTDAGISRYDGTTFYSRGLADKEPIALANLMTTPNGLIWSMAKYRARICCFNQVTGYFMDVKFAGEDILPELINFCVVDDLLMAITPHALYRLDFETSGKTVTLRPMKVLDTEKPFVNIFGMGNYVYMPTEGQQLVLFNLQSAQAHYIEQSDLLIQDPTHIRHSYLGGDHLWLCSDREGLICYSLKENHARRITLTEPENGIREARIFDIARVSDTVYIVSTRSSILKMTFDSPQLTQAPYRIDDFTPDRHVYGGLLNERIGCIYYDNANRTLWVGTQGSGVMKLRLWSNDVFHIPSQKEMGKLNQIAQGAQGYIWLAAETGLYRSDSRDITPTLHFTRWGTCHGEGYHCLIRDNEANLWVGNELGEVKWINTHTGEEVTYHPERPNHTPVGVIQRLCPDSHNLLWIVSDLGLTVFDPKTGNTLAYLPFKDCGYEVNCLCEDSDGAMWLGTTKGLRLCTREGNRLLTQQGYEKRIGTNPGLVRSLFINRYNQLFAGYTNKILTLDDKDKSVKGSLLVNRELMDGHIQCMVDDRNGNTWMGSNTGISTYNNRTGQVYHYDSSNNYFDVAYLSEGELIWATSTGLLYFSPKKLRAESYKKRLQLSGLEVNNIRLSLGTEVNGQAILDRPVYMTKELTLQHNNNNVVFTFTNLRYSTSQERVHYRLQPGNGEWQTAWDGHVRINGLHAGDYTLEVRPPMPFDGEAETLQIPLHVKRHWALTLWAFLAYILCILLILYAIRSYYHHRILARERRKSEKQTLETALDQEKEKREEVVRSHRVRDNIRHTLAKEMRSPLAMAIVPLKEMIRDTATPDATRQKAQIAYHNAVYLQDICNQILNIYQQEATEGTLNVASYTVSDLADEAVHTSHELLNVSDIQLDYDKSMRLEDDIWVDRRKIAFVLSNILSNAYRRIAYAGQVKMTAEITVFDGVRCCCFCCRDKASNTGESFTVRLSRDDCSQLEKQLHPEIGVEVMRDIAMAHDGDILISHRQHEGTEVRFYIPLGRDHFEGRENVHFVEPEIVMPNEDNETQLIEAEEERETLFDEGHRIELKPATPETKHKVLVIEDNSDIRLYLKVLLDTRYNVILAENGQEGIRLARKMEPDLILTDIMMPVMDGLECCRILKDDLKTCHIPLIMLTALTSDEDVVKGLESGADDYILKPFNPEVLRSKIKNLIQSRIDLKRAYTRLLMTSTPAENGGTEKTETPAPAIGKVEEDPFITIVLEQVKSNLQNPDFNVKRLAEMVNMSQPTLYRKVKQLTSFTIIELIRGVRLKESAELLRTKKYSVQEVAEMVGYNDVPTFRKHFIDMYGTTPSTFNS